jgi:hypothetical protein
VFADADLNGDGAMERLVVAPGESQLVPGLLGIAVRDTDGHHTLTTIERLFEKGQSGANRRIITRIMAM